jgi:hypothetical protein
LGGWKDFITSLIHWIMWGSCRVSWIDVDISSNGRCVKFRGDWVTHARVSAVICARFTDRFHMASCFTDDYGIQAFNVH